MFDFLLSEVWWMETLAASIIAAGAAIVAAVITAIISNRKLDKTLAVHDEASKRRKQDLAHGHSDLSREHTGIEKTLQAGNATLAYLKSEQEKECGRREGRQGRELDVQKTVDTLNGILVHMEQLRNEVLDLKEKNLALQRKNEELRQNTQFMEQGTEHDWEPEL